MNTALTLEEKYKKLIEFVNFFPEFQKLYKEGKTETKDDSIFITTFKIKTFDAIQLLKEIGE